MRFRTRLTPVSRVVGLLRVVAASLTITLSAGLAAAAAPVVVGPGGLSLPRPAGLPERLYAGNVFVTGGPSGGHVVIVESADPARPARWMRLDDSGRVAWEADHTCPDFVDYATVLTPGASGRALCKVGREVLAVDLATGAEAWRFSDPRPLYMTVATRERVAVSVDNEQVAVLDAASGAELARYDVGGGVLEAATDTERGPIALMVVDSADAENRMVELPIGRDDKPRAVEVTGDDPGRRLVAIDIGGGRSGAAISRPRVRWAVPFRGWSFDLEPTAGAVIGEPSDGRTTAYDLIDGHVLWERPEVEGEAIAWGNDGGVFARLMAGGGVLYGALDARRGKTLWTETMPSDAAPVGVGAGDGDLGVALPGGLRLADFASGKTKADIALEHGQQFLSARSTTGSVLWIAAEGPTRMMYVRPLARR